MVFELSEWIMIFIAVLMICVAIILSGRWISRSIETLTLQSEQAPAPDPRKEEAQAKLAQLKKEYPGVNFEDLKIQPQQ